MTDSRRKCVLLIIDGLGDLPVAALGGRTPLEAANTPVLDHLAGAGLYGLVDPVGEGETPNTHSGCGMLLGVLPAQVEGLKRGPVEAAGAGRVLQAGDIALRANFATLEEGEGGLSIVDRRAGRISSGTVELASVLAEVDLGGGITAGLESTDQHRCVLVLSGPELSPAISDTDPGDKGMPGRIRTSLPLKPGAVKTAEKVNDFVAEAHRRLERHPVNAKRRARGKLPANGVITRGAGAGFRLENVVRDRGISPAVVAGCNTVRGLARILGFETIFDPLFTAASDTDLPGKMTAALKALERNDLVYVHVKAPDIFAHDAEPEGKRDFLERLDDALKILDDARVMIALSADHTTDSNSGAHTADPVPALLYDPARAGGNGFSPVNFGEQACRNGNLTRQNGHEFLLRLVGMMTK